MNEDKVTDNGKAIFEAVLVIYGENLNGRRALAVVPMHEESEATWVAAALEGPLWRHVRALSVQASSSPSSSGGFP